MQPENTQSSRKNVLPPKEASLFKRIVKCYEQKQYKNGLKFAKQILSNAKFVDHGETLAMKGLIVSCLGKKDEALDLVKFGVKNDLKSSICWHVYGLVQKSNRKYDEAMKCYRQALKFDKNNQQILRDLSVLEIQMRNVESYLDTRTILFEQKPSQRVSWLGFAVGHHLMKHYDTAINILEEFRKSQTQIPPYNFDHSEIILYQSSIHIEAGQYKQALDLLNDCDSEITDKVALQETKGNLNYILKQIETAERIYLDLVDRNPDNKLYYNMIEKVRNIENDIDAKVLMYQEFQRLYPRAQMPQYLPLYFLTGDDFKREIGILIKTSLRKGVPPLFAQLLPFYKDCKKVQIIQCLIEEYKSNLHANRSLCASGDSSDVESTVIEPPSTEIWLNYMLAQHYAHVGQVPNAMKIIDSQLSHTPTLIEFITLKGQIYSDNGARIYAAKWMDEAQSLDTADRYINYLAMVSMIDTDNFTYAEELAAKFTRESVKAAEYMSEMQCMWYLLRCAKTHQRYGRYGLALKHCIDVDKHFQAMLDDQFDFHSYCLRKCTLRSYVQMLTMADILHSHRFFFEAAKIAVEIYLYLDEHPINHSGDLNDETRHMTASELKKYRSKQRKIKAKEEQTAINIKMEQIKRDRAAKSKQQIEKDDHEKMNEEPNIDPNKLARPDNPLDEAVHFLQPLVAHCHDNTEVQCLAFQVYERRKKPILMLRAIINGFSSCKNNIDDARFYLCVCQWLHYLHNFEMENDSPTKVVINEVMNDLRENGLKPISYEQLEQYNTDYITRNMGSLTKISAGLHVFQLIGANKAQFILNDHETFFKESSSWTWQECEHFMEVISSGRIAEFSLNQVELLRSKFHSLFPLSDTFMTTDQRREIESVTLNLQSTHYDYVCSPRSTSNELVNSDNSSSKNGFITHSDKIDIATCNVDSMKNVFES